MKEFDYLIAGLGNPGQKYFKTRHNIGWLTVMEFALKHGSQFNPSKKHFAEQAKVSFAGKNVLCILPTTYMNNSGEAIKSYKKKFKFENDEILTAVDEYNFPLGKVHLKRGGSAGGHNGLKSVILELNNDDFLRLRLGIDKNFGPGELVNYVLSEFAPEEWPEVKTTIIKGVKSIESLIENGLSTSMSLINSGELFEEK